MPMSAPITIAIVAALNREVRPLVRRWRIHDQTHAAHTHRFYQHDNAVLICGGIGATAARRATEATISLYSPLLVISAGFAGALDPKLKVGDLFEPTQVINSTDASRIHTEKIPPANAAAKSASKTALITYSSVATPGQKAVLRDSYSAAAVDMEAAAVARAAEVRGIPFAAVKVISDEVDFEIPDLSAFVDSSGQFLQTKFARHAAFRPWLWPGLIRLARNSGRASRALCARLEQIVANHTAHQQTESQPLIDKPLSG
jgi:adenosylhomocysteine nucleosidase